MLREYLNECGELPPKAEEGSFLRQTMDHIARSRATKLEVHICILLFDQTRNLRQQTIKKLLSEQWVAFGECRLKQVQWLDYWLYSKACVALGIEPESKPALPMA